MAHTILSVIIPFRCESKETQYLIDRLDNLFTTASSAISLPIEFMLVDSGSSAKYQQEAKTICKKYGVTYIYHDSEGQTFSIGACRDFGVQHAKGHAISFLDVDLRMSHDFWPRLLTLMKAWKISEYKKSFLAIPCLYLTQEGTEEFVQTQDDEKFTDFYMRYLQGDKSSIENLAQCSSVMIVDRLHYLSVGGHDPEFRGHGYEDFELYHRLLCEENIIPKPTNYYADKKTWDTSTYDGFRSHLSIIARPALAMNLFVVHLWHPRPKAATFYSSTDLARNRTMWVDKFKQFVGTGYSPEPLPLASVMQKNVLFFGKPKTNAANCLKDVFPFLGKVVFDSEYNYSEDGELLEEDFEYMLKHSNISTIIFANPYGNPARLNIYNWCRKTNFPFYCYDRGALPDSWFLDSNGFNADSSSYHQSNWHQKARSAEQAIHTQKYIDHCITGNNTLEKQSPRIGGAALADKLRIGSKKVLFVPLQRPSDTVIKYMSGNIGGYANFIDAINQLSKNLLSRGWVVVCKKHPLETELPALNNVVFAPDDANFIDLIELADRVALINSGVGVYAMMMEKPCYIFGDAFYNIASVNKTVDYVDVSEPETIERLSTDIMDGFTVDTSLMRQFISYLIHDFYSFGTPFTITSQEKDNSLRTLTKRIDFYQINLDGKCLISYNNIARNKIPMWAPLFERFGLDIHNRKSQLSDAAKTSAPASSTPATGAGTKSAGTAKVATNTVSNKVISKSPQSEPTKTKEINTNLEKQTLPIDSKPKEIVSNDVINKSRKQNLIKKYKRDPYAFFKDSKNPLVRCFAIFYKKK